MYNGYNMNKSIVSKYDHIKLQQLNDLIMDFSRKILLIRTLILRYNYIHYYVQYICSSARLEEDKEEMSYKEGKIIINDKWVWSSASERISLKSRIRDNYLL